MGLFDSFLDTASKAFDWLGNNKAALDLVSGAAKGYGAYLQNKQGNDALKWEQKRYYDEQRRRDEYSAAPSDYNKGDYTTGLADFNPGNLVQGSMADAMKVKK